MPRYIDADALQVNMMEMAASGLYGLEDMIGAVIEAPTVSPDEVRGVGKWIRISGYHLDHEYHPARYQCDQCKHFVDSGDDRNYCPNCGAKMEVSEDTRKN